MPLLSSKPAPALTALYDALPAYAREPILKLRFGVEDGKKGHYWPATATEPARIAVKNERSTASFGHELGHFLQSFWTAAQSASWTRGDEAHAERFGKWLRGRKVSERDRLWFEEHYG